MYGYLNNKLDICRNERKRPASRMSGPEPSKLQHNLSDLGFYPTKYSRIKIGTGVVNLFCTDCMDKLVDPGGRRS